LYNSFLISYEYIQSTIATSYETDDGDEHYDDDDDDWDDNDDNDDKDDDDDDDDDGGDKCLSILQPVTLISFAYCVVGIFLML